MLLICDLRKGLEVLSFFKRKQQFPDKDVRKRRNRAWMASFRRLRARTKSEMKMNRTS